MHQLTSLRKKPSTSLRDYLIQFKSICDPLAAIGKPMPNVAKVLSLLNGLGHQYLSFTTSYMKPPVLSYDDIVSRLQNFDGQIQDTTNDHQSMFKRLITD